MESLRVRGGTLRRPHAQPPWEDENVRRELLEILRAETASPADGVDGPTEDELFPIFAEGGLKPDDLVEGVAERYAEYLKEHPTRKE
jgi:exonuclease I